MIEIPVCRSLIVSAGCVCMSVAPAQCSQVSCERWLYNWLGTDLYRNAPAPGHISTALHSSLLPPAPLLLPPALSRQRHSPVQTPHWASGSMKSAQTSPSHFMVWWQECREGRHVQSRQTTNTSNYIDLLSFYVVSTSIEWRSSMKYLDIFRASPHPCWHLCDGNTCRPQTTGTQPASFLISISDSVTSLLTQPRKLDLPPYTRSDGTPGYCLETPADQHSFGLMVLR